jgi:hypothetical protein
MSDTSNITRALVACCVLLIGGCSTMTNGQGQVASARSDLPASTTESTGYARAVAGWATGKVNQLGSIVMAPARAIFPERTQSANQLDGGSGGKVGDQTRVEMISVIVAPDPVHRGSPTTIALNYWVTGSGEGTIPVRETIEIRDPNDEVVVPAETIEENRSPGGWQSPRTLPLPRSAPAGTYRIVARVDAGTNQDEGHTTLTIQ